MVLIDPVAVAVSEIVEDAHAVMICCKAASAVPTDAPPLVVVAAASAAETLTASAEMDTGPVAVEATLGTRATSESLGVVAFDAPAVKREATNLLDMSPSRVKHPFREASCTSLRIVDRTDIASNSNINTPFSLVYV